MEGDGQDGPRRIAQGRSRVATQPGGQVDSDDRDARPLGGPQRRLGFGRQRARQPRPEEGVDHQPGARAGIRRKPRVRPGPGQGDLGRVADERLPGHGGGVHLPSRLRQAPRHHIAVAAVGAGATEHHHGNGGPAGHDRLGRSLSRSPHQHRARRDRGDAGAKGSCGDARAIGGAHLGDGQDLEFMGHGPA